MKKLLLLLVAALTLAFLVTETAASSSSRKKEKAAAYAALKPWQKRYVDNGVVSLTFDADMVYMAIGNPSEKKTVADGEIWIYKNYYPTVAAEKVKYTLNTEQHSGDHNVIGGMLTEPTGGITGGTSRPAGSGQGGAGASIASTGGPQGGSMEPADLQAYTFYVAFQKGAVSQLKLVPN